jgi:membrane-associated phospholipid phosphatase
MNLVGRARHAARARVSAQLLASLSVGAALLLVGGGGRAQEAASRGLRTEARVDVPVTVGAAGLWLGLELFEGALAPSSCRACDRNPDGSEALDAPDAAARAAVRWNDPGAAAIASNLTGFVLAPVASLGMATIAAAADDRSREAPANALVIAEAVAIAGTLDQIAKLLVARQRPFAHFREPAGPGPRDPDENLSFYSGHTSLAFSLAVASGTIASMRGYRLAPVVWVTSLPVALMTGYFRIAADKHYLTDVLAGAVFGSAVGLVVPLLFHRAPAASMEPPDAANVVLTPIHSSAFVFARTF